MNDFWKREVLAGLAVRRKRDLSHTRSEAGFNLTTLTPQIELCRSDQMQPDHSAVLTTLAWLSSYKRMDAADTCVVL